MKAQHLIYINELRSHYRKLIEEEANAHYSIDKQKKQNQVLVDMSMYDIIDKLSIMQKLHQKITDNKYKLIPVLSLAVSNNNDVIQTIRSI